MSERYCTTCKHFETDESEYPCNECIDTDTIKYTEWESKEIRYFENCECEDDM